MTERAPFGRLVDADLVAYIDGQLVGERRDWVASQLAGDGELQARLTLLASGGRPFREAFEPLIAEAPRAGLAEMLARLPQRREEAIEPPPRLWAHAPRIRHRLALLAAGIALFVAGAVAGQLLPSLREAAGIEVAGEGEDEWRQAVAEYVSLYTPETLAGIPDEAGARAGELGAIGKKLGFALPLDKVALPELDLKRAELLQYDGKPLAQIAYLDRQNQVLALCIYADGDADAAAASEERAGLNIVHWSSRGRAFMLAGHMALPQLREFASRLSRQLTL